MTYRYDPAKLWPVIATFHNPNEVDPVGPSPVIIHKAQLAQLIEPWWQLCLRLKRDVVADRAFGWVLEMWGWALSTARAGVRHKVLRDLQAEPGGKGIRDLDRFYIYHYTFDLEVPPWHWSKRSFVGHYPQRLTDPPRLAAQSTWTFVRLINNAIEEIQPWQPVTASPYLLAA